MTTIFEKFAGLQNQFINFLRIGIFVVMAWIGGLKATSTKRTALFLL